jgi:dTDP-4-amino-4,6-dideoxygalactose transaminase
MIPISVVDLQAAETELVLEVLRSGRLAQGPMVAQLEEAFAAAHGVKHAIAVNNGTTALVAALQAVDLEPGDEVITSPFSFVATLNAILEAGATARFADIQDDFNIDPTSVERLIGPRTRVLMPVHLYGLPCAMDQLVPIAERYGLKIVEDAAQAHGARISGRPVGSFGLGCFSLYATKNITSGEGGLISTDDDSMADRLQLSRNQGMRARYEYEIVGHNYRMTELQAAIAIPQLSRLQEISARRVRNASRLNDGLRDIPGLLLPSTPERREHVYHQYTVRLRGASLSRDDLGDALASSGISTGIYYPRLMHDYPCYKGRPGVVVDETPNAAQIAEEVLSLPVHQLLTDGDLDRIVECTRKALT